MSSSVVDLLRAALDGFDLPATTVSSSARQSIRIATLRKDYVNLLWLQFELTDMTAGKLQGRRDPAIERTRAMIDSLLGPQEGEEAAEQAFLKWERNRIFDNDGEQMLVALSLGQIEQNLILQRQVYGELVVPQNLTPVDTYFVAKSMDASKAKVLVGIQRDAQLLERARSAIHSYLVMTELELEQGGQTSALFHRAQNYVNGALQRLAPVALQKFLSAQESMYDGGAEDLSHALTSCRRMLKALADALYPATNELVRGPDGVDRKLSDEAYRNRLLQYVREQLGRHGQGAVVQDTLDTLGQRLKSLDSLASKGVHDEVSTAEAETCVVWTYLLAADIVRIADGTSALLVTRATPATNSSASVD